MQRKFYDFETTKNQILIKHDKFKFWKQQTI